MHVLMIKTSSLGDIIHCFEGMLECYHHRPDIVFDWVVASNFSELPKLLPNVRKVIEINERQWRRNILQPKTWQSLKESILRLKQDNYDFTVDAQGRFIQNFSSMGIWNSIIITIFEIIFQETSI